MQKALDKRFHRMNLQLLGERAQTHQDINCEL